MRSDIYSLLVSGMRYFFVAAIVYILFRIVYHSVCEYKELAGKGLCKAYRVPSAL